MTPLILQCDIEAARRMLAEQRSKEDVLEMLIQRRIDPARAERLVSDLTQGITVKPDMEANDESKPKHGSSSSGDESSSDPKRKRRRKHSHSSHSSGHSRDKSKAGTLLLFLVLVTILGAAVYFLLIRDTESKAGDTGASQGTNAVAQPSKPASK